MATGTSTAKEGRLALYRLHRDEPSASAGTTSTTSTSMTDLLTMTFTPPIAGDYIIFANALIGNSTASKYSDIQLYDNGTSTAYGYQRRGFLDTADHTPWMTVIKLNLAATSQTFKIQYLTASSGTAIVEGTEMVAIRADRFRNNYDTFYNESLGAASTTSNTVYSDKASVTYTPRNTEHMIIANQVFRRAATASNSDAQILKDASVLVYNQHRASLLNDRWNIFNMNIEYPTETSTTWKTQFKKNTTGLGVAEAVDSIVFALDVEPRRIN